MSTEDDYDKYDGEYKRVCAMCGLKWIVFTEPRDPNWLCNACRKNG